MQLTVLAHAIAVATDVHQVAMMQHAIDERRRHDLISEHLAPFLEALVRGQHGGSGLVAAVHELEEQDGANVIDGQVSDLVDHQE